MMSDTANGLLSNSITLRRMALEDIPFGLSLSEAAGWNQTEADWRLILTQPGAFGFIAGWDGSLAGTVTVIPYQRQFGWIGMALVHEDFQRRGIGKELLRAAIDAVKNVAPVRLDATPAGKHLYEMLGFRDEYGLMRMLLVSSARADTRGAAAPGKPVEGPGCEQVSEKMLPEIFSLDESVFGADRSAILAGLFRSAPQLAWRIAQEHVHAGHCFGRVGRRYTHIGPVVAKEFSTARSLLLHVLHQTPDQDLIIDTPLHNAEWLAFLADCGFAPLRPFTRMCQGEFNDPGRPQDVYAIAGPELG